MQHVLSGEDIRLVFEEIIRALVSKPSEAAVQLSWQSSDAVFIVIAAASDSGMLIGKSGRTARALRVLLHAFCTRAQLKARLELPCKRDEDLEDLAADQCRISALE